MEITIPRDYHPSIVAQIWKGHDGKQHKVISFAVPFDFDRTILPGTIVNFQGERYSFQRLEPRGNSAVIYLGTTPGEDDEAIEPTLIDPDELED